MTTLDQTKEVRRQKVTDLTKQFQEGSIPQGIK